MSEPKFTGETNMTEIPQQTDLGKEALTVQLPEFTITTSREDILTKRSGFNPLPEKAGKGISVWSLQHPTTNPLVMIRYEETGEMYDTHIPLSYPDTEIRTPKPLASEPKPYIGQGGEQIGDWMSMDRFMVGLSEDLLRKEEGQGDMTPFLNEAVVKRYVTLEGGKRQPVFETPDDGYIKIVQGATKALDQGKWREAASLVNYGHRVGAYTVDGQQYSDEAYQVFDYSGRQLAFDAVPSIATDVPGVKQDRGRWDIVSDTASEIQSLIGTAIRERALQVALQEYGTNPTAKGHIETTLDLVRTWKVNTEQKLAEKKSLGGTTYLDQVKQYLSANGVSL